MIVNFDVNLIAHDTTERADEIINAAVRPDLVREACRHWAVESDIYQLGRGFIAVRSGARDCPNSRMHDLLPRRYRLRWEAGVIDVDGTSCGFSAPMRTYGEPLGHAAE